MPGSQPKRHFLALSVECLPESREAVSYLLFSLGALGCEEFENRLTAYFEDRDADTLRHGVEEGLKRIAESDLPVKMGPVNLRRFLEENWMENWKQYFQPIHIGDVLYVRPPWKPAAGDPWLDIVIEPKQAFGTGTHATTQLMLQAMAERRDRLPKEALDVGTGSGILAIAHTKLRRGSQVWGCDIDRAAIDNANENAEINGVAAQCHFLVGSVESFRGRTFSLIYANLEKAIIRAILPDLQPLLQPDGEILFSGILASERDEVISLLGQHGLRIMDIRQKEEWLLMVTEKTHG
ncbi:MAG: 50S ribosomal protein L11 methyltransferase [candidate division KSB1 bacterium]|nr:50S ribosomal protein L11 methyltransferase [candidate division KSB1 bacterium]